MGTPGPDEPEADDEEARGVALERLRSSLAELERAAEANIARAEVIRERIHTLIDGLDEGTPLPELVAGEPRPLIVELVTDNIRNLQKTGVELRRAEAVALRAHGLTISRIAELFGVTRQRVWSILADDS
jgi:hypothetical protein